MAMGTSENWRNREHLHRCPKCWEYKDCGGRMAYRCEKPQLLTCDKCTQHDVATGTVTNTTLPSENNHAN